MKGHLKSLAAPATWVLKRKETKFIVRPNPGHNINYSLPLSLLLKKLNVAQTQKEAKFALNKKNILVNGKARNDIKYPVTIFDIITIVPEKKNYIIIIDQKGKLVFKETSDHSKKLTKLIGKVVLSGKKLQLNFEDGTNILSTNSKDLPNIGDGVLLKIPENKIEKVLPLKAGSTVYLIAGSQKGKIAKLKSFDREHAVLIEGGEEYKTNKNYVFVVDTHLDKIMKDNLL